MQLSDCSLCYPRSSFAHSLPSQPERWFTNPRSSPFPRQHKLLPSNASRPLLAAGQHPALPHAAQLTSSQLRSKGELLQGASGSPGSRIPDTPSSLWGPHTPVCGAGNLVLFFGAVQFRGCPHDGSRETRLPEPLPPRPQPGWPCWLCPSGRTHHRDSCALGGPTEEDPAWLS